MSDDKNLVWLLVHTYAGEEPNGAENVWQACLRARRRTAVRSISVLPGRPGHLLIRAERSAWDVIRSSDRITGFPGSANVPAPVDDEEAQRLLSGGH